MEIEIKRVWGKIRQDRWGVVVNISNGGQTFAWMPSYANLAELIRLLGEAETLNQKELTDKIELNRKNGGKSV